MLKNYFELLAADERRLTQTQNNGLIGVHPCSSAANYRFSAAC
jgi:hypothetical protein